jgi:hypothetical protein
MWFSRLATPAVLKTTAPEDESTRTSYEPELLPIGR